MKFFLCVTELGFFKKLCLCIWIPTAMTYPIAAKEVMMRYVVSGKSGAFLNQVLKFKRKLGRDPLIGIKTQNILMFGQIVGVVTLNSFQIPFALKNPIGITARNGKRRVGTHVIHNHNIT